MCLLNNFTNDSRVLKEALSFIEAGYEVTVIAKKDDKTLARENVSGIDVVRLNIDPYKLKTFFIGKGTNLKLDSSQGQIEQTVSLSGDQQDCQEVKEGEEESYTFTEKCVRVFKMVVNKTLAFAKNNLRAFLKKHYRTLAIANFNAQLFHSFKKTQFDIIHAHDLNTLPGGYWLARKTGAKLVYDSHELYLDRNRFAKYSSFGRWLREKLEKFLCQKSDLVITVNDSIAQILADRYEISKPTIVMNIPVRKVLSDVSEKDRDLRSALNIQAGHKVILYSGAITFNRGLESLVKALAFISDCHLVMMGFGTDEYKSILNKVAEDAGCSDRFSFFGPVPSFEVTGYAASADIGVAPIENVCLSYYLCSPNKLFEYLLAGLPVVTSNFPELKRVVEQFQVGGYFDPSSPEQIASAVEMVLNDSTMSEKLVAAKQRILADYCWENESVKLLEAYESIVE